MSPLFGRGPSSAARLLAAAVVSVLLMATDYRTNYVERVREWAGMAAYPLQYLATLPSELYQGARARFSEREGLLAELESLRAEQLAARTQGEAVKRLEDENARLRNLMDSAKKVRERVLVAELLAVDLATHSRRIVLNKGTRDGVHKGFALIDADGIMGQVAHAGQFSSNALLITDPSHALPVQAYRTGLRGTAVGTGNVNSIQLEHVPNDADLREGDLLVTSGLGGRFPAGYPVGRVEDIKRYAGRAFAQVSVTPTASLERNREVLVLRPAEEAPARALDESPAAPPAPTDQRMPEEDVGAPPLVES